VNQGFYIEMSAGEQTDSGEIGMAAKSFSKRKRRISITTLFSTLIIPLLVALIAFLGQIFSSLGPPLISIRATQTAERARALTQVMTQLQGTVGVIRLTASAVPSPTPSIPPDSIIDSFGWVNGAVLLPLDVDISAYSSCLDFPEGYRRVIPSVAIPSLSWFPK